MTPESNPPTDRSTTHRSTSAFSLELSLPAIPEGRHENVPLTDKTHMAELKARCTAVMSFCKRACELEVESARRIGVGEETLSKLQLENRAPQRAAALHDMSEQLRLKSPGHTGNVPDYLQSAHFVREYYGRLVAVGREPESRGYVCKLSAQSPESIAQDAAQILTATFLTTKNAEQRQNCLLTLNALIMRTREAMPDASASIQESLSRAIELGANTPFHR